MINSLNKMAKSSFNGKISEITEVRVDNFESLPETGAKAYFLSHYHTDHMVGLSEQRFIEAIGEAKNIYIYASKMTASIVVFNYPRLKQNVKVLNLGSNLITVQANPESGETEKFINVTLIPAGHCIGSTMFLFDTTSTKVLYTGDFRIRTSDLSAYKAFHDTDGEVIKLDALYVDTTFINQSHENFPKRSDSVEEAVELIRRLLDEDKEQAVVLDTPANYGYEHVFNQIYKVLGEKVYVDDKRWSFYSTIRHLVPGVTNNGDSTRVFLGRVPIGGTLKRAEIRFSAQKWYNWTEEKCSVDRGKKKFFVCFSTHCSRAELISFVEYLNPTKVVGFPNRYNKNVNSVFLRESKFELSPLKRSCPSNDGHPNDRKVDPALLRQLFG